MRVFIAFLIGGLMGVLAGAGGMLIAFPFLFPPPVVAEAAPAGASVSRIGAFEFDRAAPGRDFIHWANGSGAAYRADGRSLIRFDANFEAGPGPNYWVYLNTRPVRDAAAFKADSGRVKLAPLKSFTGSQNYALPDGVDLGTFHTVTIWCESFSVYIGSAPLPKG